MPISDPQSNSIENRSEDPLVSVIIPTYNQAGYVGEAIRSVQLQTYNNYEIIVIDDGSTDNCREVVAAFGNSVRYIWQENQGLGGARNTGIRAANGEFVGLLDADDQWLPEYMEKMVRLTEEYPEAAVYHSSARGIDVEGRELPQLFSEPVPPGMTRSVLLRLNYLIPSTVMLRRSIVLSAGLFDQTRRSIHGCEDWDLWLRIVREHDIVGTSECLVRYRLHDNSLSANPAGMQQAARTVMEKHFGPDDGQWQSWSDEKRTAFGAVYRYNMLTSVQRQNDWQAAAHYLRRMLQIDPTLAKNIGLFYDLAMGNQPPGYRGTHSRYGLDLESNAVRIDSILSDVFCSPIHPELKTLKRGVYGTAHYAIGLLAYHTEQLSLGRRYFSSALWYRPELWRDRSFSGNLVKTFAGRKGLTWLRGLRRNTHKLEIA